MPDDTFTGKRLHAVRMIAAGRYSSTIPSQAALDEAERFVDRLIKLAQPKQQTPRWAIAVSVGGLLVFAGLLLLILPGGVG